MKKILLTLYVFAICATGAYAQKYMTRTARISFNATAAGSPEKIEGINNEVANILDAATGDMVFQVLVKSFKFERALMQEHFNENYMESDKLPKADFKGRITNMADIILAKDGTYNAKVSGRLTIHGVTHEVSVPGTITVSGSTLKLSARFAVKLQDYKVDIPSVVSDKIAGEAAIVLQSDLAKK